MCAVPSGASLAVKQYLLHPGSLMLQRMADRRRQILEHGPALPNKVGWDYPLAVLGFLLGRIGGHV